MSDTMFVAVMGLVGTLVGSLSGIVIANQLVNWRLKKLEEKVDKHNCVIERMTVAEINIKTVASAVGVEIVKND